MPKYPRGLVRRRKVYYARTYEGGSEKRISLRTTDYTEACRLLKRIRQGNPLEDEPNESGGPASSEGETIGALGALWLSTYVAAERDAKGAKLAEARFQRYAIGFFEQQSPISNLKRLSLERYKLWLGRQRKRNGAPISIQTVRHVLADLRTFLLWCEGNGHLERSPMPRKFLPRVPERAPQGFTAEEVAKLEALSGEYGYVCRLLLGLGIRWGEATRAHRDHVRDGCLVVSRTKNKRVRRIPIPPALLEEVLRRHGALIPFTQPGSFARMVRRLSGIEAFRVHRCRHHYATAWLEKGGNLKALSYALGHGSISVTERYARVTDQHVRDEAARVWAA